MSQSEIVNVSAPDTVATELSALDGAMVTLPVGFESRTTLYVAVPPFSEAEIAFGDTVTPGGADGASVTGWRSSSASVTLVPATVRPVDAPLTEILSLPSISVSSTGVSVKVAAPLDCPALMSMSKSSTAS